MIRISSLQRLNTRKPLRSSWTTSSRSRSPTTTTITLYPSGPPAAVRSAIDDYDEPDGLIVCLTMVVDVIKAADFIRLAPSVPGSKGHIWSTIPNPYEEWEVNFQMKIVGQHVGGGRGMAFWYARDTHQDGPIFGSKDNWNGLGIWFDSSSPKVSWRCQ
jgi:hypothetical protein